MRDEIKTLGIVLRRTNYGEADRIINLITPKGKISAMVRGARKEKSKLAGGIEIFTLANFNIHQGRGDLGVVTSARMVEHYGGILKDYERMEFAGAMLKQISRAAENSGEGEFFEITRQCLKALDGGVSVTLVKSWFWLNLLRASGEEVNLYRDARGEKLVADKLYDWDVGERAFVSREQGANDADVIKMLRLMSQVDLATAGRIKAEPDVIHKVYGIIRVWEN